MAHSAAAAGAGPRTPQAPRPGPPGPSRRRPREAEAAPPRRRPDLRPARLPRGEDRRDRRGGGRRRGDRLPLLPEQGRPPRLRLRRDDGRGPRGGPGDPERGRAGRGEAEAARRPPPLVPRPGPRPRLGLPDRAAPERAARRALLADQALRVLPAPRRGPEGRDRLGGVPERPRPAPGGADPLRRGRRDPLRVAPLGGVEARGRRGEARGDPPARLPRLRERTTQRRAPRRRRTTS